MVEQRPFKPKVVGSIPTAPTKSNRLKKHVLTQVHFRVYLWCTPLFQPEHNRTPSMVPVKLDASEWHVSQQPLNSIRARRPEHWRVNHPRRNGTKSDHQLHAYGKPTYRDLARFFSMDSMAANFRSTCD